MAAEAGTARRACRAGHQSSCVTASPDRRSTYDYGRNILWPERGRNTTRAAQGHHGRPHRSIAPVRGARPDVEHKGAIASKRMRPSRLLGNRSRR